MFCVLLLSTAALPLTGAAEPAHGTLAEQLKALSYKLAYECYLDGNWEIFVSNADGSNPVNLTKTPNVHEHYPQVSPDGTKICFSVDTGEGREAVRSLWVMDLDGSHRRMLVDGAREPFWRPDSKVIGFLPQEYTKFNVMDYYTKGMNFIDLSTGKITPHVNSTNLFHLYNPGFSKDGKWIVSTVHAGMGVDHAILLIEANGPKVINLNIPGCRPCFSPDGKHLAWGADDHKIAIAPIDLEAESPSVGKWSEVIHHPSNDTYHVDWSPDSRFVSLSCGPATKGDPTKAGTFLSACEIVGVYAPGWDILAVPADRTGTLELDKLTDADLVHVTTNGFSNKESAWFRGKPSSGGAK
ncbi:MAG TPA: hypothetical protein VMF06_24445 [Candidatus Limnocylindria bacterium]|jgi:Tol biopolymer transport system component|nr:hypothetical protein [Candidatus Limnocylindria bacterium]